MAATAKNPDTGGSRRPRTHRMSSSLSASSSQSADSPTANLTAEAVAALPPPGKHVGFPLVRIEYRN